MLGLPAHLQTRLCFSAKHSLTSRGVRHNYTGVLTSLNKPEFQMAIPAVTREYTAGDCHNWRKLMRLLPHHKMRLDSLAFHAEESVMPIRDVRNLEFPEGTEENPHESCHNKRTLMSPQECKIDWSTPNKLKMKHISPSLNP